ncbi:TetR/AcrR family transcriptional regulator [Thermasporomyces composti]|jgi:AcrR family transcriptional regulator|uniref:TetR family transcriptional regulator n=1 Tax=Thermasporomyces composti TaxID=696763 RepID=A0A3D9V5T1_THECX|nr:TetR/AcrR family transcriptional regulator [Thermasporomyces composti]REF36726.1 TetR family transcriptional regulator [Thermasporomyces composti]
MVEEELPGRLVRLWRLRSEPRLGRPAELDVERIVRTAVDLADRDGLAGATLPKIARELGVTTMALYRHVGSKDELVVLMSDYAYGQPPTLHVDDGRWREGLRQWASAMAVVLRRHPWLAYVPISNPPSGPHAIAWMDAGLTALRETGLDWLEKVGILSLLGGYVRSAIQLSLDLASGRRETGVDQAQVERDYARAMERLVDPERFPEAARLFASSVFERQPVGEPVEVADREFEFGLNLILDGVAAAIEAARRRDTTDG